MSIVTLKALSKIYGLRSLSIYVYLQYKNRGGTNNSKGNSFENFFTIYRIVQLIDQNAHPKNTFLSSQVFCFIDDLIIEQKAINQISQYQIKDVVSLRWDKPINPIYKDFEMQNSVLSGSGNTIDLQLVVSRADVKDSLYVNMPAKISAYTTVTHFATADSISNLVRTNPIVRDEIKKVCAINNPPLNVLETVAAIILGVWDGTNKNGISLEQLLDGCYAMNPHYLKVTAGLLSAKLSTTLGTVPNFNFWLEYGFLRWEYGSTDKGTFPHPLGTAGFMQFETDIYNLGTNIGFSDIEPFLV